MGNPSAGCGLDQAPMSLPKGPSRHRHSLSISSLPLEKLGRINCEKRASVSAKSSPARGVITEPEKQSIASFLAQEDAPRRKPSRNGAENHVKGIDQLATEDRKLMSLNPFRGHRRVGSGSNLITTPCKTTWDYSPRARLAGSSSVASSPKKLDKYAVAKIAASLFHSPAKLERSMSMSRIAPHKSSTPPQVEKKRNHPTVGEVILPGTCVQQRSPPQSTHRADAVGDGAGSSDSSAVDMEESATPLASNASSMENHVIDNTKPLEGEGAPQQPTTPVDEEAPPTSELAVFHPQVFENNGADIMHEEYANPPDVASSSSSPQSSYMPSCGMSEKSMELPDSPVSIAALFEDTVEKETHTFEEETHASDGETLHAFGETRHAFEGEIHTTEGETRHAFEGEIHTTEGETRHGFEGETRHAFEGETRHVFEEDTHVFEGETRHAFEGETSAAVDDSLPESLLFKVTEEELTEAAVRCSISSEEYDISTGPVSVSEEENVPTGSNKLERVTSGSRGLSSRMSCDELNCSKRISVVKSTLIRKRRRSVSASGIGAMLLKVVRVPEIGSTVTRTLLGSPEMVSRVDSWQARKHGLEDTAHIESMRLMPNSAPGVCETESEDAVKSTYSKFVDIEIDPGHDCVELVQHSLGVAHDGVDDTGWKRNQQAASPETLLGKSPSHVPQVKINTCTVHELGKTRPRRTKTIRRGRLNSYDLETLTEFLRMTSDSFRGIAQFDTTTKRPTEAEAQPGMMDSNHTAMSNRQRSRTFVSRLQAPSSGAFSYVDAYRPCSVSILSNPSFSSSHQDKIWEEQAEIYSSGGRGTPGREDEAAAAAPSPSRSPTIVFKLHHPPSPGFGISNSSHHHHHHMSPAMRRSGLSGGGMRGGSPSESGHFMQQIMSRIRGSTSPKAAAASSSSCPQSQMDMSKRRNSWSSCICFSVKS